MENFYIIVVVILFALAISDLVVGVSNDAVNFLNSAIGSKAAPKWIIFLMASLGVLVGATFSNGMMEVARSGIFHPEMFFFSEIMVIFLAVMITDVILLDMFNTIGMPTSTTVSIVFELLGAAVTVSIVKIKTAGGSAILELYQYINSDKALAIISGILISVVIAFTFGALIQYLTRLIFSFNYKQPMKYLGALYGGGAITAITYFMLIKGIKGSTYAEIELASGQTLETWIGANTGLILIASLVLWTILIQLLKWIFKIKILKVIVLVGTFALAMAFAGNDLVNFIGVPLAGFNSFKIWVAGGEVAPEAFSMEMLSGKVPTPGYMLLIAGLVMIITLIMSKKAQSVVATSVDLSRQNEGQERFDSSFVARVVVKGTTNVHKKLYALLPAGLVNTLNSRFVPVAVEQSNDIELPAFDKIRASVNLVVASILIALGTSLKLPLSTTYVTFMVAMGTSLADGAWDRDSAVYRITGVFAVVGGWFLTALIAFTVSGIIALIISLGGSIMIFVFIAVAVFMVVRTHLLFHKRGQKSKNEEEEVIANEDAFEEIIEKSMKQVVRAINFSKDIITEGINGFLNEDKKRIKQARKLCQEFSKKSKKNKERVYSTVHTLTTGSVDTSHYYVQIMDYKREMAHAVHFITDPMIKHFDNNHKPFKPDQQNEMLQLVDLMNKFFDFSLNTLKEEKMELIEQLIAERENIFIYLDQIEKSQIKRIKNNEVNTKNSQLFFKIISETKNLLLHTINVIKAERDFIIFTRQKT
ncbi:MAG: inorganic phosphate transporter [Prolixibacteraceae bacterium]|nr:inorganic phosphate transporter [Prolixibacteraceae bacterium]